MTPKVCLCKMAIERHKIVNVIPALWPLHAALIIAVYGLETYSEAIRLYEMEGSHGG